MSLKTLRGYFLLAFVSANAPSIPPREPFVRSSPRLAFLVDDFQDADRLNRLALPWGSDGVVFTMGNGTMTLQSSYSNLQARCLRVHVLMEGVHSTVRLDVPKPGSI
jgi:hypothetical protein